jgi:alkylation response protein AidB-like acyl-CoA dehydrogenase
MAIHSLETCEIYFDNVTIPRENILGSVGQGFRQVIATLNGERLNAAAVALGMARGAMHAAVDFAHGRSAFGRSIGAFQSLQHKLVDSVVKVESARGLLTRAVDAADKGGSDGAALSALAKIAASDAATFTSDVGMRVMGGSGFSLEYPMQRFFRDARLYTFAPFTDEMVRNFVGEKLLGFPRSY